MLSNFIRKEVAKAIAERHFAEVVRLEPGSQYLVVVKDDQTAKDFIKAVGQYLDQAKLPNLAIVVADEVKLIEIARKNA